MKALYVYINKHIIIRHPVSVKMAVISNSRLTDEYLRVNNENVECNVLNIGLYAEEFVPRKYDFKCYRTSAPTCTELYYT